MQCVAVNNLPETCGEICAHVSADVDIFHLLALANSKEIHNVELLEVPTNVISEIADAIFWEAARCSPMCGMTLQGLHSCQTQAVLLPVLGVFVHWRVEFEGSTLKWGTFSILGAPGHDKGPSTTTLGRQVTVSRVAVFPTVGVKHVNAIL